MSRLGLGVGLGLYSVNLGGEAAFNPSSLNPEFLVDSDIGVTSGSGEITALVNQGSVVTTFAPASTNPAYASGGLNGHNKITFDTSTDSLVSDKALSNFVSVDKKNWSFTAVITTPGTISGGAADGSAYSSPGIFSDRTQGYWQMALSAEGGNKRIQCGFDPSHIATVTVADATSYIVEMKYDGTTLSARVNGGAWQTHSTTDAIGVVTGLLQIGANYLGTAPTGLVFYYGFGISRCLSDPESNQVLSYLQARYGL